MDELFLLAKLFYTFFCIGIFTFGGGYAILSVIQGEVVLKHAWISETAFTDIAAISQTTPGPISINSATYIGYSVMHDATDSMIMGVIGSFTTTFALILPSVILILIISKVYKDLAHSPIFDKVLSDLKPTIVGLVSAAALIMVFRITWKGAPLFSDFSFRIIRENFPDLTSLLLFIGAFILSFKFKVNPLIILICSGIFGFLLY